jgi:hypothetical protein
MMKLKVGTTFECEVAGWDKHNILVNTSNIPALSVRRTSSKKVSLLVYFDTLLLLSWYAWACLRASVTSASA